MELVIEIKNAMRTGLGAVHETALGSERQTTYLLFDSDDQREVTMAFPDKGNLSFSVA
jgi:hypothetical protein